MKITQAQENMRHAYFGGGPGVLTSGLVWLVAGIVALVTTSQTSVITLFIGGMFIHPIGILLSKLLKRSGAHDKGNPLAKLALETTFAMFIGLFIAFCVFLRQEHWFFPIMLMVIGSRYLVFSTIYGMSVYYILGSILAISGGISLILDWPFYIGAFIGSGLEIVFAFIIIYLEKLKH